MLRVRKMHTLTCKALRILFKKSISRWVTAGNADAQNVHSVLFTAVQKSFHMFKVNLNMTVRGNSTNSQHLQFCFCILLNIFGKRIALPCSSMEMKWNPPLHSRAEAWVPQVSCWTAQILLWICGTSTNPILQDWTNPAGGGFSAVFVPPRAGHSPAGPGQTDVHPTHLLGNSWEGAWLLLEGNFSHQEFVLTSKSKLQAWAAVLAV